MRRMQIQLTEEQLERLRDLADAHGRSMADVIRESVDRYLRSERPLHREESKQRALAAVGKFRSNRRDISANHDRYLAATFRK